MSKGEGIAEGLCQKNPSFTEHLDFPENVPFAGVIFISIMFSTNGVFLVVIFFCVMMLFYLQARKVCDGPNVTKWEPVLTVDFFF